MTMLYLQALKASGVETLLRKNLYAATVKRRPPPQPQAYEAFKFKQTRALSF